MARRAKGKPLRFLSVCSGLDAASLAWTPLGFECVGFSETDPAACAVLKHHWPTVPNFGDMENFRDWRPAAFDILIGGTPCQSFSVAGLRAGLDDARGNLALIYLAIADKFRPEWLVWENVPGVFSATSHDAPDQRPPGDTVDVRDGEERVVTDEYDAIETHAFACFLAGLQELRYGFAYRTLDARYFGVPQRRRRVILVASARGWQRAAAVLFERECLRRDSPPSSAARSDVAGTLGARTPGGGSRTTDLDGHGTYVAEAVVPEIASTLSSSNARLETYDTYVPDVADPLTAHEASTYTHEGANNFRLRNVVATALLSGNSRRRHGGDDRAPLVTACFDETQITHRENRSTADPDTASLATTARPPAIAFCAGAGGKARSMGESSEVSPTIRGNDSGNNAVPSVIAFDWQQGGHPTNSLRTSEDETGTLVANRTQAVALSLRGRAGGNMPEIEPDGVSPALRTDEGGSGTPFVFKPSHYTRDKDGAPTEIAPPLTADADKGDQDPVAFDGMAVRRLTPTECARLMGVPDDYLPVVLFRGKPLSDTVMYRLLGNSFARPVIEFVGRRIKMLRELLP